MTMALGRKRRCSRQARPPRRSMAWLLLAHVVASLVVLLWSVDSPSYALVAPVVTKARSSHPDDLLVFGAGYLGRRVAKHWLAEHPGARVVGVTLTDSSHKELHDLGIEPHTAGADLAAHAPTGGFAHVAFSAPPRAGASEPGAYEEAMKEALSYWSGDAAGGFVFTSSGGVFAQDSGTVDEESPVSDSPRTAILLGAEQLVLEQGGIVLRLAGLYDVERGPHAYWLKAGAVNGPPDGIISMLHYEDAASAVVAALEVGQGGRDQLFIVSDDSPQTRRQIIEAARQSSLFADTALPSFDTTDRQARGGKVYDTRRIREQLKWNPRHGSFSTFMVSKR